jgi:hypothetical protein
MDPSVHQTVPKIRIKDFTVHPMGLILGSSIEKVKVDGGRLEISLLDQKLRNLIKIWDLGLIHRGFQP